MNLKRFFTVDPFMLFLLIIKNLVHKIKKVKSKNKPATRWKTFGLTLFLSTTFMSFLWNTNFITYAKAKSNYFHNVMFFSEGLLRGFLLGIMNSKMCKTGCKYIKFSKNSHTRMYTLDADQNKKRKNYYKLIYITWIEQDSWHKLKLSYF